MCNIFFWCVIIISIVVSYVACSGEDNSYDLAVCRTPKCIQIGKAIRAGMNESVKPCVNFYEYMCGQWKVDNPITDDSSLLSWETTMRKRVKSRIKEILEDKHSKASNKPLQQAKELFTLCMDIGKRNLQGADPFFKILKKVGKWPIVHSEEEAFSNIICWQLYYKKHVEILLNFVFFELEVLPDLYIGKVPRLTVKRFKSFSNDFDFISDVVSYFQENTNQFYDEQQRNNEIQDMVNFYKELEDIGKPDKELSISQGYNIMTIQSFQDIYDYSKGIHPNAKIDWLQHLKLATKHTGVQIDKTTSIVIEYPDFFKKLPALLIKTKPRTIMNFMAWSFLYNVIALGDSGLRKIALLEQVKRQGKKKFPPWGYICATQRNLKEAIAYEYVKRYSSENDKREVTELTNRLIEIVAETVSTTEWMSQEVREQSKEKVEAVTKLIVYPDDYSDALITEMFKEYELENSLVESVVKLDIFYKKKEILKFSGLIKKTEWLVEPTDVNAYFHLSSNSITMTAGALQEPLWDTELPKVLNFAGIGIVIGHELSHGFDDDGHKFDKDGNAGSWWPQDIAQRYLEKSKCFINQYNNYAVPELLGRYNICKVDGLQTLGENIADQAGIQISHAALKKIQREEERKDVRLPDLLEFTTDQLFYMYYAHVYCSNVNEEGALSQTMFDEHPVNSVRVIGSVSNSIPFSEAFKCNPGDPMNPTIKCSIF
ncbi:neprilysin-like [Prorops nasuta]|uniref:neprilysin-like n=1 Tax=Prorops nasuta TaxID=863751 RepID=UPI0034CE0FEF